MSLSLSLYLSRLFDEGNVWPKLYKVNYKVIKWSCEWKRKSEPERERETDQVTRVWEKKEISQTITNWDLKSVYICGPAPICKRGIFLALIWRKIALVCLSDFHRRPTCVSWLTWDSQFVIFTKSLPWLRSGGTFYLWMLKYKNLK